MARRFASHLEYARLGALTRLQALDRERTEILRAFPGLKVTGRPGKVGSLLVLGRRRTVSSAARRAMSAGMRRYWAQRKKAVAAKSS